MEKFSDLRNKSKTSIELKNKKNDEYKRLHKEPKNLSKISPELTSETAKEQTSKKKPAPSSEISMGELLWEGFKRSIFRTKEANIKIDNKRQNTYEIEKKFNDSFEDLNKLCHHSHEAIQSYHMYKQLDSLSMEGLQAADKQIRTSLDQLAMLDSDPSLRAKVDANLIDVVKELENVMDEAIEQMKAMNAKEKIDTNNTNDGIDTNNTKEEIPSQDKIAKLGTKGQKAIIYV